MAVNFVRVTCPACFESFDVAGPAAGELPVEWDYDCEVCCRPMVIAFGIDDEGGVVAEARGTSD